MITSMLLGSRLPVLRAQIATSRSCPVEFQVFLAKFDAGSLQRYGNVSFQVIYTYTATYSNCTTAIIINDGVAVCYM